MPPRPRFRRLAPMFAAAVLCVFASASAAEPAQTPAPQAPRTIGHRGSCADRPENTLAGVRRAIEAKADFLEVDVRRTSDGALVCLHDADLARSTDGTGPVDKATLADVKKLDAGAKFDPKFAGERVPELHEVLALAHGRIGVMLDLKEAGEDYAQAVAAAVRKHGEPPRTIVGVRSAEQAKLFARLLPEARLIGLVPKTTDVDAFAAAGVRVIRLWPKEVSTDPDCVPRLRKAGLQILVGAGLGTPEEVRPLLAVAPEYLSSDAPAVLVETLAALRKPTE